MQNTNKQRESERESGREGGRDRRDGGREAGREGGREGENLGGFELIPKTIRGKYHALVLSGHQLRERERERGEGGVGVGGEGGRVGVSGWVGGREGGWEGESE
jgi:hypothetical protein